MSLLDFDSFNGYATAQLGLKYQSNGGPTISAAGGRFNSANAIRFLNGTSWIAGTFPAALATGFMSWSMLWESFPTGNAIYLILKDGSTTHVDLRFNGNTGQWFVTRNGTTIATGTAVLSVGVWYRIEFKWTISDTVGVAVVRVNEANDINASALDTRNGGNASVDNWQLGTNGGNSGTFRVVDLVIQDTAGSAPNNDFLGDVMAERLPPDGSGNYSNMIGSDGNSVNNYQLVDDATPDTADYVESGVVGDKDTYTHADPSNSSGTVYGVKINLYSSKTAAGTRSIRSLARLSGTDAAGSTRALSSSDAFYSDVRETRPGGGAWTLTDVANAEFGVEVAA